MPLLPTQSSLAEELVSPPLPAPEALGAPALARPLRVAVVSEYYYPHLGGICEHVHFFAREARRRGHHIDIITSRLGHGDDNPGIIRVGRSQAVPANGSQARINVGVRLRAELRAVLRAGEYDIVHVHSPLTPRLPLLAVEEATCPVVGTFHTYFERSLAYRFGRAWFQKRLDSLAAAIAVSPATTHALERYFDADWRIIPNGVDLELFSPHAPHPPALRRDVPAILFLGRFDPRNGLDTLIHAFRTVRRTGRPAQLVVVGDGPLRAYYRHIAGADPDITFVGAVLDNRPGFYAHAAIYACPTRRASFGITLLEAMACETPIICSDIPGFRDVVRHGREALMVPCRDVNALADGLVRLLDDETLRARMGKSGRDTAISYGWSCVTDAVLDTYATVLERTAGP